MDTTTVVPFENRAGATAAPATAPLIQDERDDRISDLSPQRASASLLRSLAKKEYAGQFTYKLSRASLQAGHDVTARVKLPSFANRAVIEEMPKDIRKMAADLMFSNSATPGRVDPISNMDRTTKRGREVANLYVVVGFIDPPVYFTEAEAEADPNGVWVEDIPFEDRWTFVRICDGDDTLSARLVSPFSE